MDTVTGAEEPCVRRVAGPLVEFDYRPGVAIYDLVAIGDTRLPAEVVAIRGDVVTAQAYESTGGLRPGSVVRPQGTPLTARLGPHLLGGVFDGLLRPLGDIGPWLVPRAMADGQDSRTWRFTPAVEDRSTAYEGQSLGQIQLPGPVKPSVLVPPGWSGPVSRLVPRGDYTAMEPVAYVGERPVHLTSSWPVRRPRPIRERRRSGGLLTTGQRAIDLLFPVVRGGTAAVPGGFGTGKTMLLQQIAKWCDADVIVYVGCGERGNEMAEVIGELAELEDPRGGGRLAERTVVIANTSNMPMMAREASVHTGATVAEYFRDMGLDAVVIADSTSRWAEALREFASRTEELPAEEGYPASLSSAIAAFYERAGPVTTLGSGAGSVTVIGAISPPGGDFTEPVTAHTERFVRCLWTLDRDLAYARHYPAVSWAASFSRDTDAGDADDPARAARRARITALLADSDRLADLVELIGITALPPGERVSVLAGRLLREGLLQQNALSPNDAYCGASKTTELADALLDVVDRCREAVDAGVPVAAVEECDFGPLIRAREDVPQGDASGIGSRRDLVLSRLNTLMPPTEADTSPSDAGTRP